MSYLDRLERENVRLQGEMRDAEIVIAALVAAAGGRVVVSRRMLVDTSTKFALSSEMTADGLVLQVLPLPPPTALGPVED